MAGEVLTVMDGQVVDVTRYPVVIDGLEWNALSLGQLLVRAVRTSDGFMNHSSRPNTSIDDGGRTLRANQPIVSGDELTLDYFARPVPEGYLASAEAVALRALAWSGRSGAGGPATSSSRLAEGAGPTPSTVGW